jgi:haloacetate dehalogenase
LSFWLWSLLAAAADAVVADALSQWGSPASVVPDEVRAAYAAQLRDHPGGICAEYRAGAGVDREHDEADLAAALRIGCPTLVLWSKGSGLDTWYVDDGGPLGIWREWCAFVEGEAVDGGHFFPEVRPEQAARRLAAFFTT